jgi:hypothetical protein
MTSRGEMERTEPFFTSKVRFSSKVHELFTKHNQSSNALHVDRCNYIRRSQIKDAFELSIIEKDNEGIRNRNTLVFFQKRSYVQILDTMTQSTSVQIRYSPIDNEGNARMLDETRIATLLPASGESIYSFTKKSLTFVSGVELIAEEDELAKNLIVRDDPDAKGYIFPTEINIYQELRKFEDKLKRQ